MVQVAVRVIALIVIALLSALVLALAISDRKPTLVPQALGEAQTAAARAAAKRGESSFCGVVIPEAWREGVASGTTSFVVVSTESTVPLARCLRDQGFLDATGLAAVQQYEDARKWRWWEKVLWAGMLGGIVVFAGYLLFRGPAAKPVSNS
jgi:hypothetical protein